MRCCCNQRPQHSEPKALHARTGAASARHDGRMRDRHAAAMHTAILIASNSQHISTTITSRPAMTLETTAENLIAHLSLVPHPEGGHFKETYRSQHRVDKANGAVGYSASTAIYYLLRGSERSTWHRIQSDEMWHFYDGVPIRIHVLEPDGGLGVLRLGNPLRHADTTFQALVPAGHWFAAECEQPEGFGLAGCTVAPGFEFEEFEMGDQGYLTQHWPEHAELIARLSHSR